MCFAAAGEEDSCRGGEGRVVEKKVIRVVEEKRQDTNRGDKEETQRRMTIVEENTRRWGKVEEGKSRGTSVVEEKRRWRRVEEDKRRRGRIIVEAKRRRERRVGAEWVEPEGGAWRKSWDSRDCCHCWELSQNPAIVIQLRGC